MKKYLIPALILAAIVTAGICTVPAEYFNAKALFFTGASGEVSPVTAANPLPVTSSDSSADKIGQPIFGRVAIATATASLFSAMVGTVATDASYIITFEHASIWGPASTTAAYVEASGTRLVAGTQLEIKPGTAIDFAVLGNGAIASFAWVKCPLN